MASHRSGRASLPSTPKMSKSLLSGGTGPGESSARERGSFFPYKLGATLSALKIGQQIRYLEMIVHG